MEDILISAVVCTYNRSSQLRRAIESLSRQILPANRYEVIIVDNGSSDDTKQVAHSLAEAPHVSIRYVLEPALGLSNARNEGLRAAVAPVVAFMDDDEVADSGWLSWIVQAFQREPNRPLCVGGRIVLDWEVEPPKWLPDIALVALSSVDFGPIPRFFDYPRERPFGGNFAFDREFLSELGGFDPRLGRKGKSLLSNEDTAAVLRFVEQGGLLFYEPAAIVRQRVPRDRVRPGWLLQRMFAQGISDVLMNDLKYIKPEKGLEQTVPFKQRLLDRHTTITQLNVRRALMTQLMLMAYRAGRVFYSLRRG